MTPIRTSIPWPAYAVAILIALGAAVPAVAGMNEGLRALFAGDNAVARAEFEPLAAGGVLRAAFWLGRMAADGRGGDRDLARARALILRAAEGGDVKAQAYLGRAARDGTLGPADPVAAARWLRRAAAGGDPAAARALAPLYAGGTDDDADSVAARLKQAAEDGDPEAQWLLAELHTVGQGVTWDFVASRRGFERAAAAGHVIALARRGDLAHEGHGGMPDPASAVDWHGQAAAAGNGQGLFGLGRAYLRGDGIDPDSGVAFLLFVLADSVGHIKAKEGIAYIVTDPGSSSIAFGESWPEMSEPFLRLLAQYGADSDTRADADRRLRAFFETARDDPKGLVARLLEEIDGDAAAPDLAMPLPN